MIKEAFEQGFIKQANTFAQKHGLTREELFKLFASAEAYNRHKKTPGSDIFFSPHIKDINERAYKTEQESNTAATGLLGMLAGGIAGGVTGGIAGDGQHILAGAGLGSGLGGLLGGGIGHFGTSRMIPSDAKFLDKDYSNTKKASLSEYLKSVASIHDSKHINKNMTHYEAGLDDLDIVEADIHYEAGKKVRKINNVDNDARDTIKQHWKKLTHHS